MLQMSDLVAVPNILQLRYTSIAVLKKFIVF
jgi:hypothetical protein